MDIQKIKELALANGFKLKEQASGNMDLNAYVYDFANAVEREIKAQSDQKIKLLLCDEHLKKCESPTGIFNSQYPDEEPCLICLAKEAKAQAVPEWINVNLLSPQVDTEVLVCVGDDVKTAIYRDLDGEGYFEGVFGAKWWMPKPKAQEPAND